LAVSLAQDAATLFFGRDSIGITRLSVFLWRRSSFTFMRRFFDAFVRGLPFMVGSFGFVVITAVRGVRNYFSYESADSQQGGFLLPARIRRKMATS
jgi:hypothetical protein